MILVADHVLFRNRQESKNLGVHVKRLDDNPEVTGVEVDLLVLEQL
jgi:hypothetical protein